MKPIRVLQVVTIMNRGGLETMLMNYYRQLDKSQIQFDFLVHRNERGDYDSEIEQLGGNIYRFESIKPGNYKKYFKQLDEFFKDNSMYRVVHSHINENSGFVLRAAKKYGVPCRIAHSHLADLKLDYKYPFRLYGRHHLIPNANYFFACSEQGGQWLFGNKVSSDQINVMPNAIDLAEFEFKESLRQQMREALQLSDELVIGHVGRFNPQKNHTFLVDIFNELQKMHERSVLLLVGEGYLFDQVKQKVADLGLSHKVRFLGLRKDIAALMQAMDIFLFPSLFEGLPVVMVEAQAAGLRCITSTGVTQETNITGVVEFIDLKQSPAEWAVQILSRGYERQNYGELLTRKGYNSRQSVRILSDFYLNFYMSKGGRKDGDLNYLYTSI